MVKLAQDQSALTVLQAITIERNIALSTQETDQVRSQIHEVADPIAQEHGLVVDDVTVRRAGRRQLVTITVDLPSDQVGSADLDTVAVVSRAVSALLDEAAFIGDDAYVLEVSTPGADRPLTKRHHWLRARTRLVTVVGTDGTQSKGRLVDVTDDGVVLAADDSETVKPWEDVAKGRIELEFKKPGKTTRKAKKSAQED